MSNPDPRLAWQEAEHAEVFDTWAGLPPRYLRQVFESFNEIQLFLEVLKNIEGRDIAEIGCATGELWRYLSKFHKGFSYTGYDISESALRRAREKYPNARFEKTDPSLNAVEHKPSILFSRDVVVHQPRPFDFLKLLVAKTKEVAFIRLRTRDKGASVLDPDVSCQYVYESWVPYMVMNADEVASTIHEVDPDCAIAMVKNYVPLGGQVGRYLPKDCYYKETGTAETAVRVLRSPRSELAGSVRIEARADSAPAFKHSKFYRLYSYLRKWSQVNR